MALEEFIIDLCEESVNGALLVGFRTQCLLLAYLGTNVTPPDLLAVPNLPPRPRERPKLDRIQDVPANLQQSAAHCIWVRRATAQGEDQGEYITRHCPLELGAGQHSSTLPSCPCWAIGYCAGAKAEAHRGHHL